MTTATKYKPYPKYKPSGADWFANIPSGWEAKRLRFLTNLQKGRKPEENTESVDGLPYLTMDFLRGQEEPTKYAPAKESVVIDDGDILLLWDGANAGEFVRGSKGILSSTMARVILSPKLNSKYYFYFLTAFEKKLRELTIGMGIPHVSGDIVKDCITPIPSISEQKSITDFLDRETAKIDEVVGKKQKLIELLKEKRQALITRAVTKGLDPKAKMKPSGVDWLGEIPAGWEVKRAKYLGRAIIGLTYSPNEVVNEGEGVLILRSSNIQNGLIELNDNVYVKKEIPEDLVTIVGDILICSRNGSVQLIGKNVLIDENTANLSFGAFMTVFRSKHYEFLYYFFNSSLFTSQTGLFSTSTINQLTTSILDNLEIPTPPSDVQKEIVKYLKSETANIDGIIIKVETQIGKLQEYRQALISNAVTGKIKI